MACRLIHHINCLVRQKSLSDVTVRETCRRNQRIIGNSHAMVQLIFFLQATQDKNRVLNAWFINKHRLEPACQCSILFDILTIFIQRCRTYTAQLATRQSRLQEVRRIHRTIRPACPNELVHLIDKQNDLAIA